MPDARQLSPCIQQLDPVPEYAASGSQATKGLGADLEVVDTAEFPFFHTHDASAADTSDSVKTDVMSPNITERKVKPIERRRNILKKM